MFQLHNQKKFAKIMLNNEPDARASIKGSSEVPTLHGYVNIYNVYGGVLVVAEIFNLPKRFRGKTLPGVYGFHIHEGNSCRQGTREEPFKDTKEHYNPTNKPHPEHAGDMPPLFSNDGYAFLAFYTDRFKAKDVIGRTVVIHSHPDDFISQPAGNSGIKIGCGEIKKR